MSDFDWQIAEDESKNDLFQDQPPRRHGRGVWFWLGSLLVLLLIVGGWLFTRYQLNQVQDQLLHDLQAVVDFEAAALAAGDGDLFFSVQSSDALWFSQQLQPQNLRQYGRGLEVTNAQQVEDTVWANVTWQEGEARLQRVMFFKLEDGRLLQVPAAPDYWGRAFRLPAEWGQLSYAEVDDEWAEEIGAFVEATIADLCRDACLEDKLPVTVALMRDFSDTAVPDRLHIPSPRLVGLDETGRPSSLFYERLRRQLQNYLMPATIRFAVPGRLDQIAEYELAATAFMAQHPELTVEIVALDEALVPAEALTTEAILAYDGAAFPVTEAMLKSGAIVDVTDYALSDPSFEQADFYEQIWQGAWWRDRMWLVPQAGKMKVIYYDKLAYQAVEYPEPSLRWTWEEMAQDMVIIADPRAGSSREWGFLDTGNDALFSYAYNWENDCNETATVNCNTPLERPAVVAALTWYAALAGQPGKMPDLTQEGMLGESQSLINNWQSARRRAAIWVDSPTDYEFRLLLAPLGVLPFPGSNRFDGITPLEVHGHFISRQAENPRAVWEWLNYLSHQPPNSRLRYVPARPSVAEETGFWSILPRELGNPMRIAFPFARPVTLEEKRYFTWEQITAVLSGEASPEEAVYLMPQVTWFQFVNE